MFVLGPRHRRSVRNSGNGERSKVSRDDDQARKGTRAGSSRRFMGSWDPSVIIIPGPRECMHSAPNEDRESL